MKIENRIKQIEERNKRVELDKLWEVSKTRKISVAILTYLVVVLFFYAARNIASPFISAIVPTIGFILSTSSLPILKKLWINKLR